MNTIHAKRVCGANGLFIDDACAHPCLREPL